MYPVPIDRFHGRDSRRSFFLLQAAVGSVLLIACANIANILMARGSNRRHEMAVRSALGASRVDLLRLVFRRAITVTVAGAVAGAAAAMFATRAIAGMVFFVGAFDPWNWRGPDCSLAIVALASCYPAARSAAAADPMRLSRD